MARTDGSTPFSVVIADDEPAARLGVRQLLAAYPQFDVVRECRNGAEVLDALDVFAPDVVFLDVQMPEIGGFEVIRRRTPERMPAVVFLTAHDEFAVRAFDAEALDYLVKPVTEARFGATVQRLIKQLRPTRASRDPGLLVATARGTVVMPIRQINWIEAADNYARIWSDGRGYLLRESLRILEGRIRAHGFIRAHRRALVRLGAVRELTWSRDGTLIASLSCGTRVAVSRRLRSSFAEAVRADAARSIGQSAARRGAAGSGKVP